MSNSGIRRTGKVRRSLYFARTTAGRATVEAQVLPNSGALAERSSREPAITLADGNGARARSPFAICDAPAAQTVIRGPTTNRSRRSIAAQPRSPIAPVREAMIYTDHVDTAMRFLDARKTDLGARGEVCRAGVGIQDVAAGPGWAKPAKCSTA